MGESRGVSSGWSEVIRCRAGGAFTPGATAAVMPGATAADGMEERRRILSAAAVGLAGALGSCIVLLRSVAGDAWRSR